MVKYFLGWTIGIPVVVLLVIYFMLG